MFATHFASNYFTILSSSVLLPLIYPYVTFRAKLPDFPYLRFFIVCYLSFFYEVLPIVSHIPPTGLLPNVLNISSGLWNVLLPFLCQEWCGCVWVAVHSDLELECWNQIAWLQIWALPFITWFMFCTTLKLSEPQCLHLEHAMINNRPYLIRLWGLNESIHKVLRMGLNRVSLEVLALIHTCSVFHCPLQSQVP